MTYLRGIIYNFSKWLVRIAAVCLLLMVLLTCSEVVARYFGHPVKGSYDLIGILLLTITGFAIAYTQIQKGHIEIEFVFERLSKKVQSILQIVNHILTLAIMLLITWQCFKAGLNFSRVGEGTETVHLPIAPFVYGLAIGCGAMCLVLLVDLITLPSEKDRI
jgi:TRAP-type C4-dicarboxylate transport system permease small subunit